MRHVSVRFSLAGKSVKMFIHSQLKELNSQNLAGIVCTAHTLAIHPLVNILTHEKYLFLNKT